MQKTKKLRLVLIILFTLTILVGYWFFSFWEEYKSKRALYKNFGIALPTNYKIHGIDVSRHQNAIYWQHVQKVKVDSIQIGFAFLKATEGATWVDKRYKQNQKACKTLGISFGAYHYFKPNSNAQQQITHYIKTANLGLGDLPPVLDVEEIGNLTAVELQQQVLLCLGLLENHYKTKPILYSYANFYHQYLGKNFDAYPFWVAHYQQADSPTTKRNWHFWQHSDKGRVNGITVPVDFNVFNGDSCSFKELLLK
jgi:lysozyme